MVALLSQCFSDNNISGSEKVSNELTVNKNNDQKQLEPDKNNDNDSEQEFFPPQRKYPDIPKPKDSDLLKKGDSILDNQLDDLSEYVDYLEKMVIDYKHYVEERYEDINSQKYKVVENFSMGGSKNTNDLLIYIITCVFVLLLVDYIFKMGKDSL
tara:strand:- start:136 stop:600 length:465 start_codon:yes stop_codon:yes gene_type:complete